MRRLRYHILELAGDYFSRRANHLGIRPDRAFVIPSVFHAFIFFIAKRGYEPCSEHFLSGPSRRMP
jgi:hypothetical protein